MRGFPIESLCGAFQRIPDVRLSIESLRGASQRISLVMLSNRSSQQCFPNASGYEAFQSNPLVVIPGGFLLRGHRISLLRCPQGFACDA
eukprot:1831609-Pyramimonas_sp.AAC.1